MVQVELIQISKQMLKINSQLLFMSRIPKLCDNKSCTIV